MKHLASAKMALVTPSSTPKVRAVSWWNCMKLTERWYLMRRIIIFCFLIITSGSVLAQSVDCSTITQKAIESARKVCAKIGNNQACYGNANVEIKPRSNVRLAFSKAGDVAPLASLETITTSPFDTKSKTWGLALLNMRADLLDGNLTALVFGQASIGNGSEARMISSRWK